MNPHAYDNQRRGAEAIASAPDLPWRLDDLDFSRLAAEKVRDDETLFILLVISSFVEAASDVYTRNLSSYYTGDEEVSKWLQCYWEHEELQHGRALRTYVGAVWPEFDWERANAAFFDEYSAMCTLDEFEPTRGLEMAARCVVETGTASLYRTIYTYTDEPVLKELAGHIKDDEVRHYSYFYRFFQRYRKQEAVGRSAILRAIFKRVAEAKEDDALVAFRHAFAVRHPGVPFEECFYRDFNEKLKRILKGNFPYEMSIKMLLKPAALPPLVREPLAWLLTHGARRFAFG